MQKAIALVLGKLDMPPTFVIDLARQSGPKS